MMEKNLVYNSSICKTTTTKKNFYPAFVTTQVLKVGGEAPRQGAVMLQGGRGVGGEEGGLTLVFAVANLICSEQQSPSCQLTKVGDASIKWTRPRYVKTVTFKMYEINKYENKIKW